MDRRLFSRVRVNLEGLTFFHKNEYPINIANISENGIGFWVKMISAGDKTLDMGDEIDVEFADEVKIPGVVLDEIHIIRVRIAQIRNEGDRFYLGCRVIKSENDYKSYVEKIRCQRFLKVVNRITLLERRV